MNAEQPAVAVPMTIAVAAREESRSVRIAASRACGRRISASPTAQRSRYETCRSTLPTGRWPPSSARPGSGKSTVLRCFNRMNDLIPIARVTGSVMLDGEELNDPQLNVVELRRRIGLVFQQPNPFPTMSIYDNVAAAARQRHHAPADSTSSSSGAFAAALWDEVKDSLGQSGASLSGGQQQRLCIARALAREPGGDPDGRAVLGARPNRHAPDRAARCGSWPSSSRS